MGCIRRLSFPPKALSNNNQNLVCFFLLLVAENTLRRCSDLHFSCCPTGRGGREAASSAGGPGADLRAQDVEWSFAGSDHAA
jgi:hypothetical protein